MNFTLRTDLGDVDLLGHIESIGGFSEISRDAVSIAFYGREQRVASLDFLIRSKKAASRPKDLQILPELEALQEMKEFKEPDSENKD